MNSRDGCEVHAWRMTGRKPVAHSCAVCGLGSCCFYSKTSSGSPVPRSQRGLFDPDPAWGPSFWDNPHNHMLAVPIGMMGGIVAVAIMFGVIVPILGWGK